MAAFRVLVAGAAMLLLACSAPVRSEDATPPIIGVPGATADPVAAETLRRTHSTEDLFESARGGDVAAVGALISGGIDVRARDARGRTALHAAVESGQIATARQLLDAGADVSARDDAGDTSYYLAALARHAELTGILLDAGADRVGTRAYGGTPLIAIAERGWVDVAREILRRPNIPVDHVNDLGWTALIEAIVLGRGGVEHQEMVRLLLEAGADPNRPDGAGRSPRTLAVGRGYSEIVTLLEAAGGR